MEVGRGWAWTCLFTVPGNLKSRSWKHAVTLREVHRIPPANLDPMGPNLIETGPKFAARVELDPFDKDN